MRRRKIAGAMFFAAALALGGRLLVTPSNKESAADSNKQKKVIKSKALTSTDEIFWLDSKTIMFNGDVLDGPEKRRASEFTKLKIMFLNTDNGELSVYKNIEGRNLCFNGKRIRYEIDSENDKNIQTFAAGPIFEEKEKTRSFKNVSVRTHDYSDITCRLVKRPEKLDPGVQWNSLKQGHGFIERVRKDNKEEYVYHYSPRKNGSKKLPFTSQNYNILDLEWYEWRKSYFIPSQKRYDSSEKKEWPKNECIDGYWISPTGDVQKECVPYGEWAKTGADFVKPFKNGFVLGVKAMEKSARGLYVYRSGESEKIIDGIVYEPVISPEGCKVAFARTPDLEAKASAPGGSMYLYYANLCDN